MTEVTSAKELAIEQQRFDEAAALRRISDFCRAQLQFGVRGSKHCSRTGVAGVLGQSS